MPLTSQLSTFTNPGDRQTVYFGPFVPGDLVEAVTFAMNTDGATESVLSVRIGLFPVNAGSGFDGGAHAEQDRVTVGILRGNLQRIEFGHLIGRERFVGVDMVSEKAATYGVRVVVLKHKRKLPS